MTSILYKRGVYTRQFDHCSPCGSGCCPFEISKKLGLSVPLTVDWSQDPKAPAELLSEDAMIRDVEYAVTFANGCAIPDDCEIGVTPTGKRNARRINRHGDTAGPFTMGRLFGGNECSRYRIHIKVVYELCGGQCYDYRTCVDVRIEDC